MDSEEVRDHWADRSGEFSPEYYAHYGPDEASEAVRDVLDRYLDSDASVLELGCSSGRHLAHLLDGGYRDLTGVEVNGDAFDVMAEAYPDLAEVGSFHQAAIEDVVGDFEDDRFDAVYSVETLQHLHPDAEWVLAELVRITGDLLVTVENEGDGDEGGRSVVDADGEERTDSITGVNYVDGDFPLYYRDWNRVFTDLGLVEVESRPGDRDTVRAFRVPQDRTPDDRRDPGRPR